MGAQNYTSHLTKGTRKRNSCHEESTLVNGKEMETSQRLVVPHGACRGVNERGGSHSPPAGA